MQTAKSRFFICFLTTMFFSMSSLVPVARATMIDTSVYMDREQRITTEKISTLLERRDVQEQLVSLGVDPGDARRRVSALSQSELTQIQQKMDDLPAGSNVLAVLGVLLIVLVVLEMVGVTNIFNKL